MRFYKQPHAFYCGADLPRTLNLCVFALVPRERGQRGVLPVLVVLVVHLSEVDGRKRLREVTDPEVAGFRLLHPDALSRTNYAVTGRGGAATFAHQDTQGRRGPVRAGSAAISLS